MTREDLARLLSAQNQQGLASPLDVLNDRELELLSLMGQGYSSDRIQSLFGVDGPKLSALKQNIRSKLKLKNDLELLRAAAKHAGGRLP